MMWIATGGGNRPVRDGAAACCGIVVAALVAAMVLPGCVSPAVTRGADVSPCREVCDWIDNPSQASVGRGVLVFVGESGWEARHVNVRGNAEENGREKIAAYIGTNIEGEILRTLDASGSTSDVISASLEHHERFRHWISQTVERAYAAEFCHDESPDGLHRSYARLEIKEKDILASIAKREEDLRNMAQSLLLLEDQVNSAASRGAFSIAIGHALAGLEELRVNAVTRIRASEGRVASSTSFRTQLQDLISGIRVETPQDVFFVRAGGECTIPVECLVGWQGLGFPAERTDLWGEIRAPLNTASCVSIKGSSYVRTDKDGRARFRVAASSGCLPGSQAYLTLGPVLDHVPATPWSNGGGESLRSAVAASVTAVTIRIGYRVTICGSTRITTGAARGPRRSPLPMRVRALCRSAITDGGLEVLGPGAPCEYVCEVVLDIRPVADVGGHLAEPQWLGSLTGTWRAGLAGSVLAERGLLGSAFGSSSARVEDLAAAWFDAGGEEHVRELMDVLVPLLVEN